MTDMFIFGGSKRFIDRRVRILYPAGGRGKIRDCTESGAGASIVKVGMRQLLLIAGSAAVMWAGEPGARALMRQAAKAEKNGNIAEAVLLYNRAGAKGAPAGAVRAAALLRQRATEEAGMAPLRVAATASPEELGELFAPITDRELREARELLPPPQLELAATVYSADWRETPDKIWERAGRTLGLEVLFDGEYPQGGKAVRYQATDQTGRQVLQGLSTATGSFVVALGPRKILVVKDTTQKRQEREPTVAVVLTLPDPTSAQELQEAARVVQQAMEIQKFAIDNTRRMVLMRDRVSKIRPAQHLFEQLLGARPAVVVELELYELRRTGNLTAGVGLPTSSKLFWLSRLFNNDPDKVDPGAPMATFGGGGSLIGMTLADATVTATALKSFGVTVQRAFLQSVSGQPGQLLLGERYPILAGGYFGSTDTSGGQVFAPPPQIQYENLGLTMKVTPFVHDAEEMTLDVEAEFKLLSGAEINGLPILANRKFTTRARMRNGQWAILSGLTQESTTTNVSGIPGLMQIPWLGAVLRNNTVEKNDGEFLVLLKPRLLGAGTDLMPGAIFLGSEGRPAMIY
jgi:general secretion pathway protein D